MKTAVFTAGLFCGVLCLGLMLLGGFGSGWMLGLIRTPQEVFADSKLYLDIYVYGLPFVFFYNMATGIFSAMGDSRTPFRFLAVSSLSNIAVDILFVKAFQMGYNLLSGIMRSLGDSKTPLYFLIVSSVVNIALALFFILVLGWGVPGSAVALVIAQAISAILCLVYIYKRFPQLHIKRKDFNLDCPLCCVRRPYSIAWCGQWW